MSRAVITVDEAKKLLPEGDTIHTFRSAAFGLLGADWSRKQIDDMMDESKEILLTGAMARSMRHGIAVAPKGITMQSELVFVETNEAAVFELEALIEKETPHE